ncbi:CoA transferase [Xanthobacter sp. KR7-225]|uniref:CaiB/BaiF CoA transferase family protein n=1 Tax=Xanthobacter sp. KR7-225 TaxID=3156613 RepID=UPI0032B5EDDF
MKTPLSPDLVIVEIGERIGASVCGALLAELGATVVLIEPETPGGPNTKGPHRTSLAAGKRSLLLDRPEAAADAAALIATADAVLVSSDLDRAWPGPVAAAIADAGLACDVTAFGAEGDAPALPDGLVQALSGVMDVTGDPDGPPIPCNIPILEFTAGFYAASSVLLALGARARSGAPQQAHVAMFDCAFSMLTTFLPRHFAGGTPNRIGNHHPSMSPWNAYRARDGWVMVCSGSNDQWVRICQIIGRADLADDPRFTMPTGRVAHNPEVDRLMEQWTAGLSVAECVARLDAGAIPAGPVARIADLAGERNLRHRGMVQSVATADGATAKVPGALFRGSRAHGRAPDAVARAGADRSFVGDLLARRRTPARPAAAGAPEAALAGLRVLEIGQYTTAPLCARQLGAFGADVVKIEPPGGEPARLLPPLRDGQGYFFTMSNSDKRGVTLDLRDPDDAATFAALVAQADVLVENMKPGALGRFGFAPEALEVINPRLVYCAVSGFGADAPDRARGAMDTTIQAAAGIMDAIQHDGVPYKAGISLIDLVGGQLGLVFILAALDQRARTGAGQFIDLSMLDAAAWMTRLEWNGATAATTAVLACADGHVAVARTADRPGVPDLPPGLSRSEVVRRLADMGVQAAPVLSVSEVAQGARVRARGLMAAGTSPLGAAWPLLATPIRLPARPAQVRRAMGPLGCDAAEVLADWGVAAPAPHAAPGRRVATRP